MTNISSLTSIVLGLGTLAYGQAVAAPKPGAFHLGKLGYVMLGVASVPTAVAFYHGKLGLEVAIESDDLAFFDAGAVSIAVSSEVGKKIGDEELVFVVEHVQEVFDALTQAGIVFVGKPHAVTESAWAASFRDPDGHLLTAYGPR
jgi:catechol 2,3-dioxygenase-like lactoylglutathione lyase family enzyme